MKVIELLNISASYNGSVVLNSINLVVREGELVLIIGPNGAGKSTLLKVMAGFITPLGGSVKLLGRELSSLRRSDIARIIAYLPQNLPVVYPYTVSEIVAMGRTPYLRGFWGMDEENRSAVCKAIQKVGIQEMEMRRITELSGGERQLVFLARAIAQETPVLLLDEPGTYLDLKHRYRLFEILRELKNEGKTIITVSHDIFFLKFPFDSVIALKEGRLVKEGKWSEMLNSKFLSELFEVQLAVERRGNRVSISPIGYYEG